MSSISPVQVNLAAPPSRAELNLRTAKAIPGPKWIPWIFAAKTTASGLLALLVAFTFNLDQPYWALLTVFIVSQPQQSGQVLAKSFYRVIGTLIGAAIALLFVALFAQERVLFLGALALWIGLCAFGSQYARNSAAYSFVLSGYTVAIVGIPGALDAGNAYYIATGRVTEVCLGIIVAATINHVILPSSLGAQFWKAVVSTREALGDYSLALFEAGDTARLRAKLLGQAIALENLRSSALFEDREIRDRGDLLRFLDTTLVDVVGVAQLLTQLNALRQRGASTEGGFDDAISDATVAIRAWRATAIDASALSRRLLGALAHLPFVWPLSGDPSAPVEEAIRRVTTIARLREFFSALTAYAEAYEALFLAPRTASRSIGFNRANDGVGALWTGVRAALAVFFLSGLWILADWPHGSTAVILGAVATARLATMAPAVPIAAAASLIFSISTIPAFTVIDVLLPRAQGFAMFAMVVAPMLFLCALLMAHRKTMIIGYLSALLFASTGQFQNHMIYEPVDLINTSIAAVIASAAALVLWAIVAPQTPEAARRRFVRTARAALARIAAPQSRISVAEFETAMTEALDQLRSSLRDDQPDDIAIFEAGMAFLGVGRELIRTRESPHSPAEVDFGLQIARLAAYRQARSLERARRVAKEATAKCLAELRKEQLGAEQAPAAARELAAFIAIEDGLERCGKLVLDERAKGTPSHVA
jgi:uncharacterized membrane protein YccC